MRRPSFLPEALLLLWLIAPLPFLAFVLLEWISPENLGLPAGRIWSLRFVVFGVCYFPVVWVAKKSGFMKWAESEGKRYRLASMAKDINVASRASRRRRRRLVRVLRKDLARVRRVYQDPESGRDLEQMLDDLDAQETGHQ